MRVITHTLALVAVRLTLIMLGTKRFVVSCYTLSFFVYMNCKQSAVAAATSSSSTTTITIVGFGAET